MIESENLQNGNQNLFVIRLRERLTEREYRVGFPQIESDLGSYMNLFVLLDLRELEGWETGARWKSLRFDSKHRTDVKRIAMVGGRRLERWIRRACRPLKCPLRSFEHFEEALDWILQESKSNS